MNELGCPENYMTTDSVTGLQYSFNYGLEVKTPTERNEVWTVQAFNADTDELLIDVKLPAGGYFSSPVKYYIKWYIKAYTKSQVFSHIYDCTDKYVLFKMTHDTLGDCIAYMSQVQAFVEKHKCKPVMFVQPWFEELFSPAYPDYKFITNEYDLDGIPIYATYFLGIIFDPNDYAKWNKYSYQQCGLQHIAGNILGLSYITEPQPPKVVVTQDIKRDKPYVAISYSGSKACKLWWNPVGWKSVIEYLHRRGFDVMCIDRDPIVGMPGSFYYAPNDCINCTGPLPLQERVNQISGAEFFIGMASGLSWLAWACRKPVIMISGFSRPEMEFYTPYRVFNEQNPCNDCWGDPTIPFYHHVWDWCPRVDKKLHDLRKRVETTPLMQERLLLHREYDTEMQNKFSCTRNINQNHVIKMIEQVIKDYDINV